MNRNNRDRDPELDPPQSYPRQTSQELLFDQGLIKQKLESLNRFLIPEQKKVVHAPVRSNVVVQAKAGSGKTTTLLARVLKTAVTEMSFDGIIILCYSNNAVDELKSKISERVCPAVLEFLEILTYHAYCLRELNVFREIKRGGGERDMYDVIPLPEGNLMDIVGLLLRNTMFLDILPREKQLALRKIELLTHKKYFDTEKLKNKEKELLDEFDRLQKTISIRPGQCYMDYNRIICEFMNDVETFKLDLSTGKKYCFFDEMQDLDVTLSRFLKQIMRGKYSTMVGDKNQSIFMFSGKYVDFEIFAADNLLKFQHLELKVNHRAKNPTIDIVATNFLNNGVVTNGWESKLNGKAPWGVCNYIVRDFETQSDMILSFIKNHPEITSWGVSGTKHKDLDEIRKHLDRKIPKKMKENTNVVRWRGKDKLEGNIVLTTTYGAKGSEFGGVFVVNANALVHPNFHFTMVATDIADPVEVKRGRNVWYVSITRAISFLVLFTCLDLKDCPTWQGRNLTTPGISPFIAELGGNQFCRQKAEIAKEHPLIEKSKSWKGFRMDVDPLPLKDEKKKKKRKRKKEKEKEVDRIDEDEINFDEDEDSDNDESRIYEPAFKKRKL